MSHILAITFFLLPAMVGMTSCVTAYGDGPPFRITTKRDSDKVEVAVEKDKAVISIRSPFGISQAIIERHENKGSSRNFVARKFGEQLQFAAVKQNS